MNKTVLKAIMISFPVSLILLLFRDRIVVTTDVTGISSYESLSFLEYFLNSLWLSIVITAIISILVYLLTKVRKSKGNV